MKYAVLFIALLFAGCDEGSSTEEAPSTEKAPSTEEAPPTLDGGETITISGKTIQVAKEDFPSIMGPNEAMWACEGLGNGWRLPTKEELVAMYEQLHKQGKGHFKNESYWSSSSDSMGSGSFTVYFYNGSVNIQISEDLHGNHLRVVRALP